MARRGPPTGAVERFRRKLLRAMGQAAMRRAKRHVPSRTLRRAMTLVFHRTADRDEVRVHIPHYWALYVHDGRGAFGPRKKTWLVWFTDPKDDPRTDGGRRHPVREKDIRRLTKEQFHAGLRENSRRRALGLPPYMIVTKQHPGNLARPFFDNRGGMAGYKEEAAKIGSRLFSEFVRQQIASLNETDEIVARL